MNKKILLLLVLLPTFATAAEVYRWRDAHGVWHFSDKPADGAQKIEVREPQTVPANSPGEAAFTDNTPTKPAPAAQIAIVQPGPEATVRMADGRVDIGVSVQPGLGSGDQVRVTVDGRVVGLGPSTQFTAAGVERGTHTVSAELMSADGRVVARAGPQNFYVHQPSVLNRKSTGK